ncbi:MAG: membrane protein insertion efficiency factor YidD [Bdellovibrionales bacterium]
MNFSIKPLAKLLNHFESAIKNTLLFLVAIYRTVGSQHFGGQCRFQPSCSQYAVDCLKTHNALKAVSLIIRRIGRCHPFGSSGWDPAPPKKGLN